MAIRTELLSPSYHVFSSARTYIAIVGEHGTMMMMLMSSLILGPLGNYLLPLMIGSKRMAFPRLEALSFWLTPAPTSCCCPAILFGGFPFGWTGYRAAVHPGHAGRRRVRRGVRDDGDLDDPARVQHPRHRDLLPRARDALGPAADLRLGDADDVVPDGARGARAGRRRCTCCSPTGRCRPHSSSTTSAAAAYLYQNLFWFFGHPEVYILALPGFGVVSEILPVFCRKPLFGYKVAAAGMIGVTLLSFFVWQHHLFDSGINPDMRPLFMLTTELISIPTGFIFLVAMGTFWKAKIRFTVPMLFALGFYFNFLIGGISGVYLSDVPPTLRRTARSS
jgi:cytochrome c oxidase subunit 1